MEPEKATKETNSRYGKVILKISVANSFLIESGTSSRLPLNILRIISFPSRSIGVDAPEKITYFGLYLFIYKIWLETLHHTYQHITLHVTLHIT